MKKYYQKITSFYKNKLNLALLVIILLFLAGTMAFRYFAEDKIRDLLTEQALTREEVIARSGAESIESFLDLASKSLVLLSKDPDLVSGTPKTQEALEKFISDWEATPIVGIIVTNNEGTVLFNANKQRKPNTGVSMADREYFIKSKKAPPEVVFLGKPIKARLGPYKDQYLVTLATPIYENGEFRGVLNAALLLAELAETYLHPLKISENTQVYLMSLDGTFLHSPHPELVGQSIVDRLRQYPFPGNEQIIKMVEDRLHKAEEGKFELSLPNSYGKIDLTKYLLAYSPIKFDDQAWLLAVATPIDEILAFSKSYKILGITTLFMRLLVIVAFSSFLVIAIRISRRDAFLDGLNHGKKRSQEKK